MEIEQTTLVDHVPNLIVRQRLRLVGKVVDIVQHQAPRRSRHELT